MAKRKQETPPPGSPAWMATFSDLMNLLLCFFVLLFSMSNVDEKKFDQVVASMSSAFSILDGGATAIGDGILVSNGVSQLNELSEYINSMGATADSKEESEQVNEYNSMGEIENKEQYEAVTGVLEDYNLKENEQLAEMISEAVAESNMSNQIEVSFTAQYVLLSLKGALLFDSGKAELRETSDMVMLKIGVILEKYAKSTIEIEGHTDNIPINTARFANNNELSSARALAVFDYLMGNTSLDPANIKHSGRGEYVPVADNGTEEGRAKNRRVEIKIYNPPLP